MTTSFKRPNRTQEENPMDPVRHSNDALNTERERERKHFARQKKKDVGRRAQFTIAFTFYQPLVAHTHTYRGMLQQPIDHPPTGLIVYNQM
jgi:hypothetical protein